MSDPVSDPLTALLARMRGAAVESLGDADPVVATPAVLKETARDMEILSLAQAGLSYVEIGRRMDLSLPDVVRRVTAMLKGVPLYSEEHLAGYMMHQLDILSAAMENALADMGDWRDDDDVTSKIASTNRHNGRMALNKLLIHQAAILGLLRQRIDVTSRQQIEIAVVRGEEYDAL